MGYVWTETRVKTQGTAAAAAILARCTMVACRHCDRGRCTQTRRQTHTHNDNMSSHYRAKRTGADGWHAAHNVKDHDWWRSTGKHQWQMTVAEITECPGDKDGVGSRRSCVMPRRPSCHLVRLHRSLRTLRVVYNIRYIREISRQTSRDLAERCTTVRGEEKKIINILSPGRVCG